MSSLRRPDSVRGAGPPQAALSTVGDVPLLASDVRVDSVDIERLAIPPLAFARQESRAAAIALRALDITVAALLLLILAPLFAAIALAIRLDSPGRIIYRQKRLGHELKPFTINKFRTMHQGVGYETHRTYVLGLIAGERPEDAEKGLFKMSEDDRVTRVGRWLRRSSFDELPQLWNVLRGNMSLVGPRPPIDYEVEHYPPHWFARFSVKPGVTGLWQVSGRSELTLEEMITLDIEYARRRSLGLNVMILLRTVPAVLRGRGAA
jgi:lipopolysaccharide/colanic/teichoic acid biosynthesis glycosyltransferase